MMTSFTEMTHAHDQTKNQELKLKVVFDDIWNFCDSVGVNFLFRLFFIFT